MTLETKQEWKIDKKGALHLLPGIPDKSIDLILTDLPYGQTDCKWDSNIQLELLWDQYKRILTDNGVVLLTAVMQFAVELIMSNRDMFRYDWVWEKSCAVGFLNANKMPMRIHEFVLVFYNHLPTFNPQYTEGKIYSHGNYNNLQCAENSVGDKTKEKNRAIITESVYGELGRGTIVNKDTRHPTSITRHPNPNNNTIHPTQKPLSLWEYLINTYSNEGDTIHDSCLGAGTTLEACVNLNRNCVGFEISDEWEWNYHKILDSKKNMYQLSKIFKMKC